MHQSKQSGCNRTNVKIKISPVFLTCIDACIKFEQETARIINSRDEYQGITIGSWLMNLRYNYKYSKISKSCLRILNMTKSWPEYVKSCKRDWQNPITKFDEYIELCLNFEQNVNPTITYNTTYFDIPIGQWLSDQSIIHNYGTISLERLRKLEQISSWPIQNNQHKQKNTTDKEKNTELFKIRKSKSMLGGNDFSYMFGAGFISPTDNVEDHLRSDDTNEEKEWKVIRWLQSKFTVKEMPCCSYEPINMVCGVVYQTLDQGFDPAGCLLNRIQAAQKEYERLVNANFEDILLSNMDEFKDCLNAPAFNRWLNSTGLSRTTIRQWLLQHGDVYIVPACCVNCT